MNRSYFIKLFTLNQQDIAIIIAVLIMISSMAIPFRPELAFSYRIDGSKSHSRAKQDLGPIHYQIRFPSRTFSYVQAFREMADRIYRQSRLYQLIDREGFERSFAAFYNLKKKGVIKKDILVIIDYRQPSYYERFYVVDMKRHKLLYKSLVAHGKNSGMVYANRFSNRPGSHMSSIGTFLTGETYRGRHGYSLNLLGLEKGINDQAEKRRIVIHGADYVSRTHIRRYGHLGRSFGCPALPKQVVNRVINTIKDGSCVVILGDDPSYYSKNSLNRLDRPARFPVASKS